jgi:hypothetical protein
MHAEQSVAAMMGAAAFLGAATRRADACNDKDRGRIPQRLKRFCLQEVIPHGACANCRFHRRRVYRRLPMEGRAGAVGLSGRLSHSQVEKESRSVNRPL